MVPESNTALTSYVPSNDFHLAKSLKKIEAWYVCCLSEVPSPIPVVMNHSPYCLGSHLFFYNGPHPQDSIRERAPFFDDHSDS